MAGGQNTAICGTILFAPSTRRQRSAAQTTTRHFQEVVRRWSRYRQSGFRYVARCADVSIPRASGSRLCASLACRGRPCAAARTPRITPAGCAGSGKMLAARGVVCKELGPALNTLPVPETACFPQNTTADCFAALVLRRRIRHTVRYGRAYQAAGRGAGARSTPDPVCPALHAAGAKSLIRGGEKKWTQTGR